METILKIYDNMLFNIRETFKKVVWSVGIKDLAISSKNQLVVRKIKLIFLIYVVQCYTHRELNHLEVYNSD